MFTLGFFNKTLKLSMQTHLLRHRANRLFFILGGFFVANALIAEFIGVKIFSFESSFGLSPLAWELGGAARNLDLTAGVLLWPIVFVMTDLINEYYGRSGVKFLSYLAAGLISYGFLMIFIAIRLSPAQFWVASYENQGISNMQQAFAAVFGQGLWIIIGSLIAFLLGQILDAFIFYKIKKRMGDNQIWFRATVSTLVSQLIDSYLVLYIAFRLGNNWSHEQVLAIGTVNYMYKVVLAILLLPFLYLAHRLIEAYLGQDLALQMKARALGGLDD